MKYHLIFPDKTIKVHLVWLTSQWYGGDLLQITISVKKNGWFHEWIVSKVQSNFQASQHDFFLVKMVSHVGKMGTHVDLYGETMSHPWCDGRCSGHQALSFSFRSATSWETRAPWPGRCVTCLSKIKVIGVRHSSTALGIYENTKWLFHSHAVPVTVTSGKLT